MASFTETLTGPSGSRRIIDPQNNKGPSFLEGLANLGSNLVSGGSTAYRQAQADGRQQATAAAKARTDSAENAAADFSIDLMRGQIGQPAPAQPLPAVPNASTDDYGQPVPFDSELAGAPPPPGVTRAVDEIVRARAAEEQGRAPQGTSRITIEARLSDLLAQYPDQQAVLLKTFREAGVDHALFREWETEQKIQDTRRDAELGDFTRAVEAASKAGLYMPGMSPEDAAATGRGILAAEQQIKVAQAVAEAQRAAAGEGRASAEFAQKQFDREATTGYLNIFNQVTTPLYNTLSSRITEAGMVGDDGSVRSLEQVIPEAMIGIDQITTNLVARAEADNAGPEVTSEIRRRGEQMKASITQMWSGDGSQFKVRQQALTAIQTNLGLNSAEAMPVYTGLSEILGQGAVNQIFQGNPAALLPPGTLEAMRREIQGIQGIVDTPQERASMATVAGVLRGDLGIENLTEQQATQTMPTLVHAHTGNAKDIANGGGNVRAYVNSGFAVVNALVEIQPGRDNNAQREMSIASATLFNADQTRADIALYGNDKETAQPLVAGKRAAATHVLNTPINILPQYAELGWKVEYVNAGPRAGTYQAQLDRNVYNRDVTARAQAGRQAIPFDEALRRGAPEGLRQVVGARNLALNYMVATTAFDDEWKGVNQAEVRRFFGRGEVPAAMQQQREREQQSVNYRQRDADLRSQIQGAVSSSMESASTAIEQRPTNELQRQVVERAASQGLDEGLVMRLVQKESAWRTGARNGTTGAAGLFQINDNVTRTVDENIDQGLKMLGEAQRGATRVLGRRPENWETYVMFQQGPGGGAALLNPANATKKAVDVLTPAYRGNAALARQAITANGGNLNMTAAEFAKSIGDYFNG